jgi:DNA-binding MarR family transcriptional regulator
MTTARLRSVPDLSYFLDHLGHVLRTRMTAALAEIDITPRHQCVLVHAMERELTQIQLAELTDVDKTTMVVTLDDLERAGLVERRPSSTDRRARIVHVTEEGAEVARRGRQIVDRVHGDVLEALPETHREVFAECLSLLAEGHLSEPVECETPVRRARRSRK